MLRYLPYVLVIGLWIYAFVDCLGTPEREVRGLPKVAWVLIILLFGEVLVGPLAWLIAGRRRGRGVAAAGATSAEQHPARRYGRGGTDPNTEGRREWIAPDDNPDFLRSLSELNKQNRKDGPPPEGE
ncbi:MAG TPA: PLD nuclease N-terminal domain-containing protein [Streptomyces sp.]